MIDLTSADNLPLEFAERVQLAAACCGEDVVRVGEVGVKGEVERTSRGYHLTAHVETVATLHCVRCLGEFPWPVNEALEIELVPLTAAPRDDEVRLGKNELNVVFFETPVVDLIAVAAEQVELSVPMKPLCSPDCRGICSGCGKNLNEGPCACPPETDARWAALLQWRSAE